MQQHPALQVAWARYLFHAACVLLVALALRRRVELATRLPFWQIARGLLALASAVLVILALAYLPVTEVVALLFSMPLFVIVFSAPLLGERLGRDKVAPGFLATLAIVKPGSAVFHWASLLPVVAAVFAALMRVTTRHIGWRDPPHVTLAWMAIVGLIPLSLVVPLVWSPPSISAWLKMARVGAISAPGHFGMIGAITRAPVSVLAPFSYVQITTVVAADVVLVGDLPDPWTLLGAAVIIGAGITMRRRERGPSRGVGRRR